MESLVTLKWENILKIELMVKVPLWDLSSPWYSHQEQSMFDYRGWFVSPNTTPRGQLFINSVTSYAYDAADVRDDDNYATLLKSYDTTSSLWVAKVHTEMVPALDHLVLAKKWGISPEKTLNMIHCTTQQGVQQCCTHPYLGGFGEMIEDYHIICTVIHCLPLQCLREAIGAHQYSPPILAGHSYSQWSWKVNLWSIVPSISTGWGVTCCDMWQCERNSPWWK